ncbi:trypsin-like peptidase domain-containing protein [Candidatus Saccharibacteria bacterium]|nr:trypsin-like peptidase domain-containing protein [Candidatus Saccharibacteria bacterium]
MQDSSTNPYIPQETKAVRSATETLHSPLKRIVKLLLITTITLAVLIGGGLFFVIPRTAVEDAEARVALANALQPPGQLSKLVPVKSTLGFTLKYDNQLFTSYAETVAPVDASGKQGSSAYFENDDLRTSRDYNLIRITPAESSESDRAAVADPPQLLISSALTADELKANETKPDYKGLSQLSLFVQLSTDKRLAAKTADDGTTVSIDATKPSGQTINGVKYQKVRFTTKNENYRIANQKYDDCYYTIQNDTPVSACVTNVRPNSRDDATLGENALQSLSYQKSELVSDDETEGTDAKAGPATTKQAVVTEGEQLPLETPKPEYNTNFTSLSAIAKNQPSAVRIGSLYCADLNLKIASGDVVTTLTDACVGNLASGTIVSNDGYVATSGHAIRYSPKAAINGYINFADSQKTLLERLDRVLEYLLKARLILDSDADYLRTGAQVGDQEALAKIENIGSLIPDNYVTATKDSYSYAVQPTNKPLVVDASTGARPSFAYSDSVIEAKFVAADFDTNEVKQENFDSKTPAKDVGLLKLEGSFQNVVINAVGLPKANDILNTIGYQSFGDTSLVIGKNQNTPVVTNGAVNQTYDKDGQQLVQVATPVVPGTDGAGVFNQNGEYIGLGVYRLSYCPDQQCFANGTVRSASELTKLVEDKNLSLGSLSEASKVWVEGIDDYFNGNYSSASANFAKAGKLYGFNAYAAPLQKLASSKQGSASDTSLMNQLRSVMIIALIVMVVLTIIFVILFILQKRRLDSLRVGHYGAQPPYVGPSATPQQQQQAVVQQLWQPQQSQQVQPQYSQPQGTPQPLSQQQPYPQQNQPQQPMYGQQQTPPPYQQPQAPQQQPSTPEDPFYRQ